MKQKIMISAATQCFEFEGEITEIEQDYIILKAKHGDIYIERKHLVFIQYLNDEEEKVVQSETTNSNKVDAVAKFIGKRLKHDPVDKILEKKFIPPSQLPDDVFDDNEVIRNSYGAIHDETAITKASNLKDAIKTAMQNPDNDFAMGISGGKYQSPAQTILSMKNANNKKS